jgi:hypothetical protein
MNTERRRINNMHPNEPQIPRSITIDFCDGGEHHRMEADVTGMPPDEIQDVAEMLVDDMLVRVGLIEVARYEEGE